MTIQRWQHIRDSSNLFELNVSHFSVGNIDMHSVNTFPFNVLSVVLTPDDESRLKNLTDGNTYRFNKTDDMLIVPCHLSIRRDVVQSFRFIALHFNVTFPGGSDLFSGVTQCITWNSPEMRRQLCDIAAETNLLRATFSLKSLLWAVIAQYAPDPDPRRYQTAHKYASLFQMAKHRRSASLSVQDLADFFHMRSDVFSRMFKRDTGTTPQYFLHDLLTKAISSELISTEKKLRDIADTLDFCSEFHMSAFFKKKTGMSPSEFRANFAHQGKVSTESPIPFLG